MKHRVYLYGAIAVSCMAIGSKFFMRASAGYPDLPPAEGSQEARDIEAATQASLESVQARQKKYLSDLYNRQIPSATAPDLPAQPAVPTSMPAPSAPPAPSSYPTSPVQPYPTSHTQQQPPLALPVASTPVRPEPSPAVVKQNVLKAALVNTWSLGRTIVTGIWHAVQSAWLWITGQR